LRHVTYITEVSFKTADGQFCPHVGFDFCEECKPKELTLIGHWDVDSTIQIARQSNLGMYRGIAVKELLIQYFAIDQKGQKVPPKMLEHYSEGFEGPAEFIVNIDDNHQPLTDEIVNE
jgi:hypothetical protein